jgi:hypothetical protein
MRRSWMWIGVAFAAICVIGTIAVTADFWRSIGGAGISPAGWIAMGLGVLFSLALGIGLMALVFFSNRRGYDEQGRDDPG